MTESLEHIKGKEAVARFASDELGGGRLVLTEACCAYPRSIRVRPDVFALIEKTGRTIDIEVEPDLRGIEAEYRKPHRKDIGYSITDYQYLAYPKGLNPDLDMLKVPIRVGIIEWDKDYVCSIIREPLQTAVYYRNDGLKIIAAAWRNALKASGKQANEVRSSNKAVLTKEETDLILEELKKGPMLTITAAKVTRIKRTRIAKALRSGIAGVDYDESLGVMYISQVAKETS